MVNTKMCDFCCKQKPIKDFARVKLDKKNTREYCPDCLPMVLHEIKSLPWYKDYIISYPYDENTGA